MTNEALLHTTRARVLRRTRESLNAGGLPVQDFRDLVSDARLVAKLTQSDVESVLEAAIAQVRQ